MSEAKVFTFDVDHQHLAVDGQTPPQLSPLLNSLRNSVLSKREARGEGPIQLEDNKPKKYELREDEKEKRERRKKQNREAARRCRLKKKHGQTGTNQKMVVLKKNNDSLLEEVKRLRSEVQKFQTVLNDHELSGTCVHQAPWQTQCPSACIVGQDTGNDHDVPINGQSVGPPTYSLQTGGQGVFQVPDPCYSPVSSCSSPYPDQQTTFDCSSPYPNQQTTLDCCSPYPDQQTTLGCSSPYPYHQETLDCSSPCPDPESASWQLPDEENKNMNNYYALLLQSGFDQRLPETYAESARTADTSTKTLPISGSDMWLNQHQNAERSTPEMIQDDHASMSMYSASLPNASVKPGPEVTTNGNIGIPSLDAIQLQELVPTQLFLADYFPMNKPQQ